MKHEALKSLCGGKKALSGMVGGQAREQTVLTPDWLLEAIGPIFFDPCTTPENPCKAVHFATEADNGLEGNWPTGEKIYCNPPYGDLKSWITKCEISAFVGCRVYLLAPFRPHRRWFVDRTREWDVVSLAPFAFKGHKQSFPAPLCLVCYNLPVPNLGKYETGRWRCA